MLAFESIPKSFAAQTANQSEIETTSKQAQEAMAAKNWAAAVADGWLKRYPDDRGILFHSSRLYADRAYDLMTQLMRVAPSSVWLHYATAEVHTSLQRYDLAIREYRNVLAMEPRMPGIHFRLGRAIMQSSKETNAVEQAVHEFELEL